MKAQEKLVVFENVLARVGLNENTLREYNKAISGLMGYQSQMEMMPPTSPSADIPPPATDVQPLQTGTTPQPTQSTTPML